MDFKTNISLSYIIGGFFHQSLNFLALTNKDLDSLECFVEQAHSRFRGLVNCEAPSMENRFQVAKLLFEV